MLIYKHFSKIPRYENILYKITEKIDGTNACVIIDEEGNIGAQSRSKLIVPGKEDNFGFASWVQENKQDLLRLGPGYHYGEWWGRGIQRGYGQNDKIFSLFSWWLYNIPNCCRRVPVFSDEISLEEAIKFLREEGSLAAPGYNNPEGLVIKEKNHGTYYKVIINK